MKKFNLVRYIALIVAVVLVILYLTQLQTEPQQQAQARLITLGDVPQAFKRADGPVSLVFPQDFGPHPEFQTEWWYYTGNLATDDGRRFGYQLTIFRRALLPQEVLVPRQSNFATEQIYLAHFAITDVNGKKHSEFERFARGAGGLAGAQAVPYRVWVEDWAIEEVDSTTTRLRANHGGLSLDLLLADEKGPVLHGISGYSQKGPNPGNASYYYSQTRLTTQGTVTVADQTFTVSGFSWKDHEYSTSALSADQVGWDWFALQLDDGTELKVFHIRKIDGSIDPYSSGSFIDRNGSLTPLAEADFEIVVSDRWESPANGALYPSRWTVSVPSLGIELEIAPYLPDQEMNVSYNYWEGAVYFSGTRAGNPVSGSGYVELTGYAGSMAGEF